MRREGKNAERNDSRKHGAVYFSAIRKKEVDAMQSVVVLNRNFEFWTEVPVRKVLKWLVQNKIEIIVEHDTEEIGGVTFKIKMPLVVRLLKFVGFKPKSEKIPFSQDAVFYRDDNVCQYWHDYVLDSNGQPVPAKRHKHKCNFDDRTVDHIVPVSRSGENSFLNTVCACRYCNEILKKNLTPQEAGLELIRKPFVPVRDRDSYVIAKFTFNPGKLAHKRYVEVILGGTV